ncbi:hypothetical protein [Aquimarina algicola]|uniref:Uncharacterized protein n=1 Tax=Aquimarina algicola TaxID=2589995 RepID=A0A504JDU1_9FLAO|nr:hypothetical protein [Aquimarina algicola]TPN89226.1 hypothetical protein FHK87_03090 [Aquimarina algicola]
MSNNLTLSGGIVAYVIKEGNGFFYYSENSTWLLDDWEREINDKSYFKFLTQFELDVPLYATNVLKNNLPQVLIDFDNKRLINNYYDQALEDRVPRLWNGTWVEDINSFLDLIPKEQRYWESTNEES